MTDRLKEKIALVFGAGSIGPGWGNGKATAVAYAREGAKVIAVDLNLDAANETTEIIRSEGGMCEAIAADVTVANDVARVVAQCLQVHGRIDILHNNVGMAYIGGPVEMTEKTWNDSSRSTLEAFF